MPPHLPSGGSEGSPLREPGARTREARGSIGRGSWKWPQMKGQLSFDWAHTQQSWSHSIDYSGELHCGIQFY